MNGIIGLETSFALSYTYLVRTARITLPRLIELMSANPARICGVQAGGLAVGDDADLFVYDLDEPFVVDENKFQSKARNMPFGGMKLFGKIKCTYLRGVLTHQE